MFKHEMLKRTCDFALQVVRLCQTLPNRTDASVLGKQLLRCGTSVGANYRAACHAKSRADFLAKIKICEEEADECEYWLDLLVKADIIQENNVTLLRREAHELASILTSATRTTRDS